MYAGNFAIAFVIVGISCGTIYWIFRNNKKPAQNDWFTRLFGFTEGRYSYTKRKFELEDNYIISKSNNRKFSTGNFTTPTLASLRKEVSEKVQKNPNRSLKISHFPVRDIYYTHQNPEFEGAMFQVASQFNCLEFPNANTTPENGITKYQSDLTQGPACSLACPGATLFRNYFATTPKGNLGQTKNDQINNLDLLEEMIKNKENQFWKTKNGYTDSTPIQLDNFNEKYLDNQWNRDDLLGAIKIGLHVNTEVIDIFGNFDRIQTVNQAFCSAISIAYSSAGESDWSNVAKIVLDSVYESTLLAAVLNYHKGNGSNIVLLTFIGGGVFGNNWLWIINSIARACAIASYYDLDVRIAYYRRVDEETADLLDKKYEQWCDLLHAK